MEKCLERDFSMETGSEPVALMSAHSEITSVQIKLHDDMNVGKCLSGSSFLI